MTKAKLSLEHNVLLPIKPQKNPPLLVMLHGYGSDENDLFSFADQLNQKFLVVSLKAPHQLPWGGNAWYEINYNADATKWTNIPQAITSRDLIAEVVAEIQAAYNTNVEETYLLGFSQGAILSYAISLNYPHLAKNILALSGYIEPQLVPDDLNNDVYKSLHYFASHGEADEIIPVDWARKTRDHFKKYQLDHNYHEYQMGHGINPECFRDMVLWLSQKQML